MRGAAEQGDEADEAFGGTNPRAASGARPEVPPNARAGQDGRGHRFAAYPRCWADSGGRVSTTERKRAAGWARELRSGAVSFEAFAKEFGESPDELIAELFDLIEHEPQRGGFLGVTEQVYAEYQANIEQAIRALDEDGPR